MNILKNKFSLLLLFTVLVGFNPLLAQQLRVASYNLRYDNPGDSLDNWKYRKDVMGKQILFHGKIPLSIPIIVQNPPSVKTQNAVTRAHSVRARGTFVSAV